jgi:hypothetical protein
MGKTWKTNEIPHGLRLGKEPKTKKKLNTGNVGNGVDNKGSV